MEEEDGCDLYACVCCWRLQGSPEIPYVSPGRDYVRMPSPADADGRRPAWSLLVGFNSGGENGGLLRMHRLRVARCGRILGRSNDLLDIFHDLRNPVVYATAALTPDGGSLCLLHQDHETPPQALTLRLHAGPSRVLLSLPPLPLDPWVPCCPISAAGHTWVPSTDYFFESRKFTLVMHRLDKDGRWEKVGDPFVGPDVYDMFSTWNGRYLQGCTVLPLSGGKRTLILVSLKNHGLFFTFDCSTHCWTKVSINTSPTSSPYGYTSHIPILGHGVYIEEDDAVYMLSANTIYTYKLQYDDDHHRLNLEPPIKLDSVCPFMRDKGYGLLAHLSGRLMCSVWISVGLQCSCKNLHAIVTTFEVPAQGGIKVLHSTCRQIDLWPSMPHLYTHEFCFLQAYKDEELSHSAMLEPEEDPISSDITPVSLVLDCCRWNLLGEETSYPSHVKPAIDHMNRDLFIICQTVSQSFVYKTSIMEDDGRLERDHSKPLKPFYSIPSDDGDDSRHMLEEQSPPLWHFVCDSEYIYAVSGIKEGRHLIGLRNNFSTFDPGARWTSADPFIMAIRVGHKNIAVTDALQVFRQIRLSNSTHTMWLRCSIDLSHLANKKVKLSGYAVLGDDSFIVYDTVTSSCLLFDLSVKQWRVVMPSDAYRFCGLHMASTLPRSPILNGRCVFADGFIYTCGNGGLVAYELLEEGNSLFLSHPIFLIFSWHMDWEMERMCLDYAGKDNSGAIIFFVVQGGYSSSGTKHDVCIATVRIKTEKILDEKIMKPVGIDSLDCVTRFVEHEKGVFSTRSCFAVGSF